MLLQTELWSLLEHAVQVQGHCFVFLAQTIHSHSAPRPFPSDFDGAPSRNYTTLATTVEAHDFSHHSTAKAFPYCTLYNLLMTYPRLPRLTPLVGLETGFYAPLPMNCDEL